MYMTLLLLGVLLAGLVLLIIGIVVLLKAKSKILGLALVAVGVLLTLLAAALFLAAIISTRTMG